MQRKCESKEFFFRQLIIMQFNSLRGRPEWYTHNLVNSMEHSPHFSLKVEGICCLGKNQTSSYSVSISLSLLRF